MAVASSSTSHLNGGTTVRQRHDRDSTSISGDTSQLPQGSAEYDETEVPLGKVLRRRRPKARSTGKTWSMGREGWVREGFRRFGEHCARNQIRTLLIDCLVMTNLFYPSLALYLQRKFPPLHPPSPPSHNTHRIPLQKQSSRRKVQKEHPLSLLSTPILDSFFPYPPPLLPRLTWAGWWGRDTGQRWAGEDDWGVTRVNVGQEIGGGFPESREEIRIMRIGWADVGHVLDRDGEGENGRDWEDSDGVLLALIWDLVEDWERSNVAYGESCVRQLGALSDVGETVEAVGPCYLITADHNLVYDEIPLIPLSTLTSSAINTDDQAVPIGWNAGNVYHSVAVLFHVPRNGSASFESRWLEAMAGISKQIEGEVFIEAQQSRGGSGDQTGEWLLTHSSMQSFTNTSAIDAKSETLSSLPTNAVLLIYIALLGLLLAQLSNATKVHSRFGLAFTGVVQLICSAVMSFSVVALLGWNGWGSSQNETTLPFYVLPFVIVVVGVDNMSTLTKAVFSVPFDHSVPVRIGLGLSRAGITIALTSFTDVIVMGTIWLFVNIRPVREFCVFACVVIITDWFMLHTFFLTVLSIDAQRLELADVLAPPGMSAAKQVPTKTEEEVAKSSTFSWRGALRARTTKSGSLILLLLSVGLLYYFTENTRSPNSIAGLYGYIPTATTTSISSQTPSPTTYLTSVKDLIGLSSPEKIWRSLNPQGWPFIRIIVPAASIIVLPRAGHSMLPKEIRKLAVPSSRLLLPRLKPLFYMFKVVILPQAVTAGALYILLLYLLKDSELLDAQRNRQGRGDPAGSSEELDSLTGLPNLSTAAPNVTAHMLPCSHESDVDIISSSPDGKLVLSVGLDNVICLWRFVDGQSGSGTRETVKSGLSDGDPISAATISDDGRWMAVGSAGGAVQIWEVNDEEDLVALPLRRVDSVGGSISALMFDKPDSPQDLFATTASESDVEIGPTLLIGLNDGSVYSSTQIDTRAVIASQNGSTRIDFYSNGLGPSIVISSVEGTNVWTRRDSSWASQRLRHPKSDVVTSLSQSKLVLRDFKKNLIVVGYRSGRVDLFDQSGDLVVKAGQAIPFSETIRKAEVISNESAKCTGCGTTSSEGYCIVSSTKSHVYIDRVQPHSIPYCRCSVPSARRGSIVEDPLKLGLGPTSPANRISPGKSVSQNLVVAPSPMRGYSPGASPKKSPSLLPPQSNGEFPLSSHGVRRYGAERDRSKDESEVNGRTTISPSPSGGLNLSLTAPMTSRSASYGSSSSGNGGYLSANGNGNESDDMDVIPLGGVISQSGGWTYFPSSGRVVGIRRAGFGIDDSQWQIWILDLHSPWNGTTLNVESVPFNTSIERTRRFSDVKWSPQLNIPSSPSPSTPASKSPSTPQTSVSMKDRRAERLLSLNGRAAFPSPLPGASFSVPTHPTLAYVSVHPIVQRGDGGMVAGFGNRLGLISFVPSPNGHNGSGAVRAVGGGRRGLGITPPPPQGGRRLNLEIGVDSAKKVN